MAKYYTLKPQVTPLPKSGSANGSTAGAAAKAAKATAGEQPEHDPFIRAETEDDDGYDPYSDRPPTPEPQFQENPWD